MTYEQYNSFYVVSNDVYTQFYELIKQDKTLYEHLMRKSQQTPFYLDFLRDTWILFYYDPKNLIFDPLRALYLLIRKTILDIATYNRTINQYFNETTKDKQLALYYAALFLESTSIYFKQMMKSVSFQQHIQLIASYYHQNKHHFEPNIVTNGIEKPLYAHAQTYVLKTMLHPSSNDASIEQIFKQNLQKQLSILDVLALNHDSCMDFINNEHIKL